MENNNTEKNPINQPIQQRPILSVWYAKKKYLSLLILALVAIVVVAVYFVLNNPLDLGPILFSHNVKLKSWQTYTDSSDGFQLQYPSNLFLTRELSFKDATSTAPFSIQSEPSPQLFHYYNDPKTNKLTYDSKPYHRTGFSLEVTPVIHASNWNEDSYTKNIAHDYSCQIDKVVPVNVSGIPSYKYMLNGDYAGEIVVVVPYRIDQDLEIHFQSNYKTDSQELKSALEIFDQILATFKFTNITTQEDFAKAQAQAITQITLQKYSNPFVEFEYSSDFEISKNKFTSGHTISAATGKDLYGFVGVIFQNTTIDASTLDITILPNQGLGDEQFDLYRQDFEKNKSQLGDSFIITTVNGQKASFQHMETFDNYHNMTCNETFRLGSNKISFFTKDYVYEINLTWSEEKNNDPNSLLQKEFQRLLDSFTILKP